MKALPKPLQQEPTPVYITWTVPITYPTEPKTKKQASSQSVERSRGEQRRCSVAQAMNRGSPPISVNRSPPGNLSTSSAHRSHATRPNTTGKTDRSCRSDRTRTRARCARTRRAGSAAGGSAGTRCRRRSGSGAARRRGSRQCCGRARRPSAAEGEARESWGWEAKADPQRRRTS